MNLWYQEQGSLHPLLAIVCQKSRVKSEVKTQLGCRAIYLVSSKVSNSSVHTITAYTVSWNRKGTQKAEGKDHNTQSITGFGVTLIVSVACVPICQTSITQVVLVLSFLQNVADMTSQLQLQADTFRKAAMKFPPSFTSGIQDPPCSLLLH